MKPTSFPTFFFEENTEYCTDSRQLSLPANTVFFAIGGTQHDGHAYIPELYEKGVRHFVIEKNTLFITENLGKAVFIRAESSVEALQLAAAGKRAGYRLPVVGVTGSNGKTIVKEWLYEFLCQDYIIAKSPKSYNSQIGVPLSVSGLKPYHTMGIFEAGISQKREMGRLEKIIQPTIGIFTNLGPAHDDGFASRQEKAQEKFKLFENCKTLVYCKDYPEIEAIVSEKLPAEKRMAWSFSQKAELQALSASPEGKNQKITFLFKGETHALLYPFQDDASIENATHCVAVMAFFGYGFDEIQKRLNGIKQIPMRLSAKEGANNCLLIDDTYNNDFEGLKAALNFQAQQNRFEAKTVLLSDILGQKESQSKLYAAVNELLKAKKIKRLVGVGAEISKHRGFFETEDQWFFADTAALSESLAKGEIKFQNESVLIKGARRFGFEEIVESLALKTHGTLLEVNLDALRHNFNFYKSLLKPQTKIMAMVKALAYGSGSYEVANLLQQSHVDYLAVAYADEGVELREKGIKTPIMVMNPSEESFAQILRYGLEPEIYSPEILRLFSDYTSFRKPSVPVKIHVKIDTGMRRLGFEPEEMPLLIKTLEKKHFLTVKSAFSHLASADESSGVFFSLHQIAVFKKAAGELEAGLGYSVIKHILNSAGIGRFAEHQFDMARLGIGLYGVDSNSLHQEGLQTVTTLKATISQIKKVPKGQTVGYSRRWVAEKDSTIATLAIGYADGLDRRFGNGSARVFINGKPAPIVGNICMDMCFADITGLAARAGDAAVIFGGAPTLLEQAKAVGTIPYELLTNVGGRVKRVFYSE